MNISLKDRDIIAAAEDAQHCVLTITYARDSQREAARIRLYRKSPCGLNERTCKAGVDMLGDLMKLREERSHRRRNV